MNKLFIVLLIICYGMEDCRFVDCPRQQTCLMQCCPAIYFQCFSIPGCPELFDKCWTKCGPRNLACFQKCANESEQLLSLYYCGDSHNQCGESYNCFV